MTSYIRIITVLSIPLMILNILGGIVSGIWLAILGQWGILGLGILFFFISTWLLSLALAPSFLLTAPTAYCIERGKTFGFICFAFLSILYTFAIIMVWSVGILLLFTKDATANNIIPRLIWSYGVATGPLAYMASKEQGSRGEGFASIFATFLAELAYLVVMLTIIFKPITVFDMVKVFGGFMLVGLVVQISLAVTILKEQNNGDKTATLEPTSYVESNNKVSPTLIGEIEPGIVWYDGLAAWENIVTGREIPMGKNIYIAPKWRNISSIPMTSHINLMITYPDTNSIELWATQDQDQTVTPNNAMTVQFQPFACTMKGTYMVTTALSSENKVLDTVTFTLLAISDVAYRPKL